MPDDDELDDMQRDLGVNIDKHDENGSTVVYTYCAAPHADVCVRVEFGTMNPPIEQLRVAARAVSELRYKLDTGWPK